MCKVCDHPNRAKIDAAIVSGTRYSTIFHEWIGSGNEESWIQAFKDHKRNKHITKKIIKAVESGEIKQGLDLLACAQEIYEIAVGSAKDARQAKQFGAIGSCLAPAAKVLDTLNKGNPGDDKDKPKESAFWKSYGNRAAEVFDVKQA